MRRPDPYPLHRPFCAPAYARRDLWRVLLVVAGFEAAFMATPYLFVADAAAWERRTETARDTLLEFGAFIVPCLALLVMVRLVHRRGLWSLIGPRTAAWRDLRRVFIAVVLALALPELIRLNGEWSYIETVRPLANWLVLIPAGLAVLLVQVGTEEIYFRGYLQQQLAVRFASPWVWMVLPSIFFGLSHITNGVGEVQGLVWAIWAGVLGVACADLTARTGNLGAALGLHMANNAYALFMLGVEDWPGSGLALFLYGYINPTEIADMSPGFAVVDLTLSLVGVLVMWLAARVAVRR